uniref:RRM domain-containing protein n=1 Tax=Glossina brevipalpis TaxID=37001 RepID=A0A1A9WMQ9_9MUSC
MLPYKKTKPPPTSSEPSQEVNKDSKEQVVVSGQLAKQLKKKKQKRASKPIKDRGVIFIKHLPHGFFEEQMKNYFSQFGDVTRTRLVRSRRTGGSKGYAFIEFRYPEVAQVAAETMNNYLMFQKVLKSVYIPPEEQKYNYFRSSVRQIKTKSGKLKWVSSTTASIQRKTQLHNDWSEKNFQKRTIRQMKKLRKLDKKFSHLGVDFSEIVIPPEVATKDDENEINSEVNDNETEGKKSLKRKFSTLTVKSCTEQKKKSKTDIDLEDSLDNTINTESEDGSYISTESSGEEEKHDSVCEEESNDLIKTSINKEINSPQKKKKKMKKSLSLKDLLSETIQSDSEDESFIASPTDVEQLQKDASEDNKSVDSEDEGYVLIKSTDGEPTHNNSGHEDNQKEGEKVKLKAGNGFGKSLKVSSNNIERFDQILKRKPHAGGIQKKGKKPKKAPFVVEGKKAQQKIDEIKKLAKPLYQIKSKKFENGTKKLKATKKIK